MFLLITLMLDTLQSTYFTTVCLAIGSVPEAFDAPLVICFCCSNIFQKLLFPEIISLFFSFLVKTNQ